MNSHSHSLAAQEKGILLPWLHILKSQGSSLIGQPESCDSPPDQSLSEGAVIGSSTTMAL